MRIEDIEPDKELANLLVDKVLVNNNAIPIYAYGDKDLKTTPSEFVEIMQNGAISSKTYDTEVLVGNLAVSINVKATNNQINKVRLKYILKQVLELIDKKPSESFFFEVNVLNIINTTNNLVNGYASKVLNINWHSINKS